LTLLQVIHLAPFGTTLAQHATQTSLLQRADSVVDDMVQIFPQRGKDGIQVQGLQHVVDHEDHVPQSYQMANSILYSVNDYSGHTHTNRVLAQNGSIMDYSLDDHGYVYDTKVVGDYLHDMVFNGHNVSVTRKGQADRELEYSYHPFPGVTCLSAIYLDARGTVVATKVIAESNAGGTSTLGETHTV